MSYLSALNVAETWINGAADGKEDEVFGRRLAALHYLALV